MPFGPGYLESKYTLPNLFDVLCFLCDLDYSSHHALPVEVVMSKATLHCSEVCVVSYNQTPIGLQKFSLTSIINLA